MKNYVSLDCVFGINIYLESDRVWIKSDHYSINVSYVKILMQNLCRVKIAYDIF